MQKDPELIIYRPNWLSKIGGAAALITGLLFITAVICFIISILKSGTVQGLMSIQNNWLLVLFKLNIKFHDAESDLIGLNLIDMIIMFCSCILFLGLYAAFSPRDKIWAIIAAIQPFIGFILFIITQTSGRCGTLSAVLFISAVMLLIKILSKTISIMGVLAGVFLLIGDIFTTDRPSIMIAGFIATGYVLITTWFVLIGQKLFLSGRIKTKSLPGELEKKSYYTRAVILSRTEG